MLVLIQKIIGYGEQDKMMIIVQFHGGLGNQMYQYAFYQKLKHEYPQVDVKADLDRYIYEKYIEHNGFELIDVFQDISLDVASTKEILGCGGTYERHKDGIFDIGKKVLWNGILRKQKRYRERCVTEDVWYQYMNVMQEEIEMNNIWLSGYWANMDVDAYSDFAFKKNLILDIRNKGILEEICRSNSVSIHVRKGDYVATGLDIVGMEYYKKAVGLLEGRYDNLKYFVFSDDKPFISENFTFLNNYHIVMGNDGKDSYKDMQLMSLCRHNIICNSTFSTWGARLNTHPDKCVIVPEDYLNTFVPGSGGWIGI